MMDQIAFALLADHIFAHRRDSSARAEDEFYKSFTRSRFARFSGFIASLRLTTKKDRVYPLPGSSIAARGSPDDQAAFLVRT